MIDLFETKLIKNNIDFKIDYISSFGTVYYSIKVNGKTISVRVADHESKRDISDIDINFVYKEPNLRWLSDGVEEDEEECEKEYYSNLVEELFDILIKF